MTPTLTRRHFVTGLGLLAAGASWPLRHAHATSRDIPTLRGTQFDLAIGATRVNLTGRDAIAITANGTLPAPTLHWREGDTVTLRVANHLREDTSLHWHGILLPANMDGVPGLSFDGIRPGETFTYRFDVHQAGTYWYHAHSSLQEARGLLGAIVIAPRDGDAEAVDQDHVLVLSDWSDADPHSILRKLRIDAGYYNRHPRTVGDFLRDARRDGTRAALADRGMWGRMRMTPTDLADVGGIAYTYLVNGQPPDANFTALFAPGQRVRLRFVNASATTYFDVRIPGLKLTVVAADGQPVHPVTVDEFRLPVAETLDVIVEPKDQPYTVFAQAMDRGGYARATLSPRPGLAADVPPLDPRPLLTMADMGHGAMDASTMDHAQMDHATMDHAAMGHAPAPAHPAPAHPASETGNPAVDMQAMSPSRSLGDPGVGLRGNGRRVLTMEDLRSRFDDPDGRAPSRTLELHLTGNMERYQWGFDGIPFSKAAPVHFNRGERLRIVLVNDTMMDHPIHLHGMWSDVESEDGAFQVRKHTVSVPPGATRSYRVTADAPGAWAYHCHMLMHMELGMFRAVHVA